MIHFYVAIKNIKIISTQRIHYSLFRITSTTTINYIRLNYKYMNNNE